jgi:hypothetical protein
VTRQALNLCPETCDAVVSAVGATIDASAVCTDLTVRYARRGCTRVRRCRDGDLAGGWSQVLDSPVSARRRCSSPTGLSEYLAAVAEAIAA